MDYFITDRLPSWLGTLLFVLIVVGLFLAIAKGF